MARTRTADLGGALEGLQSALVELASLRDVSEIVEAALRWELELMSSELAFVRLAGEPGDAERLHTRSATAGEGVEAQRLDDLLS
ncbi:MAG TPA: hypothetical protein VET26_08125, partial [Candidatus Sulfotelmatobacter sp.]|nr:hypothetical protein [Candidatus Sulfotelmatobacter sp.]